MTKFLSSQCYKTSAQNVLYTNSREFVLRMNRELFDKIYLGITDKIYRLAIVMLGDSNEAQDVVQDLYENLLNKRASLNISKGFESMIIRSAKNLCIDKLRLRKRKQVLPEKIAPPDNIDGNTVVGRIFLREHLMGVITELPEKQRLIVQLRDIEGYDFNEIAEIMECDQAIIRVTLSRARKKIKEELIKTGENGKA